MGMQRTLTFLGSPQGTKVKPLWNNLGLHVYSLYIHTKYCRDKRHVMSLEVWNFQVGRESEGRGQRILGIKWGGVSGQEDLMEPQACVELR